jgi:AhpD family alkylhydroperoxidase
MSKLIRYVPAVEPDRATGGVAEVYQQVRQEMGRLPEAVMLFSSMPELLGADWATFRESVLATGHASRATKEAVAATVSQLNRCPYCVDAHTIMLYGSGAGEFATQLLSGHPQHASDPALRAVSGWAAATATRGGAPRTLPFPPEAVPEMIGTLVHFQFINRVINVLVDGTFLPGGRRVKGVSRRVAGRALSRYLRDPRKPGAAPGLPAPAPDHLPADLEWAAGAANIAASYTWLAAVTDRLVETSLPRAAVAVVEQFVSGWDGSPPGPGRGWLDEPLFGLAPVDRPAARLALLTAFAAYQVIPADVEQYRASRPGGTDLLAAVAWPAFLAARRIGSWAVPVPETGSGRG